MASPAIAREWPSATTTQTIELGSISHPRPTTSPSASVSSPLSTTQSNRSNHDFDPNSTFAPNADTNVTTAIPDGGYGWTVIFACAIGAFWHNGMINCWGVLQAALLSSTLKGIPTSTVSFVGSLTLACIVFGLFAVRLMQLLGSRMTAVLGILFLGGGLIGSSFTTSRIAGLFGTSGVLCGLGGCLIYTVCNTVPLQYFSKRLGLANGLVKLGGGIGGTVMAVALDALVRRVGIEWTFRTQGLLTIATGVPIVLLIKDRDTGNGGKRRLPKTPFIELSMFRSLPFTLIFLSGSIGTFALFVPPYFLPLFAKSMGLSSSTGAGLVAGFNLCNAIGRFLGGPLCDRIGPVNTFLGTMLLNTISMLAIWPVSSSLGPLVVFAMLNGVANGSFFTTLPTVVGDMFGPQRAAVAISLSVTGWTGGYLFGAPIAGYLLQAGGGTNDEGAGRQRIDVYRPAIFYAGGTAFLSSVCILVARARMTKKVIKRV